MLRPMISFFAVLVFVGVNNAGADTVTVADLAQAIQHASIANATVAPFGDLINWKVGDSADYTVAAGSFGNIGTSHKEVTKDEGTAIWLTQKMDLMIQKQTVEVLINKADGKTLKMIVNGQEQAPPSDKIEIISQDYTEVKVPAGTFKVLHIVAKSTQVKKLEVWANPKEIPMDGAAKQFVDQGQIAVTMELKSFKKQ